MKWKECDIIRLDARKSFLFRHLCGDLCFNTVGKSEETVFIQPFHLYILSDDEIKGRDWILYKHSITGKKWSLHKVINPKYSEFEKSHEVQIDTGWAEKAGCRKIIASTDPSLNVARPSDKFLKEYCMLGGIDKVMVEYTECSAKDYEPCMKCLGDVTCNNCRYQITWKPDINSDNTIIIKKIKDSWNRNEVDMLLRKYLMGYHDFAEKSQFPVSNSEYAEFHNLWVKENLY